jgi:hypothetical protein
MSVEDVAAFNRRSSANTSLIATGLFEAGITWSGVMFLDYKKAGVPDRFQGVTYDGPHEFNAQMQGQAFAWLDRWLKP